MEKVKLSELKKAVWWKCSTCGGAMPCRVSMFKFSPTKPECPRDIAGKAEWKPFEIVADDQDASDQLDLQHLSDKLDGAIEGLSENMADLENRLEAKLDAHIKRLDPSHLGGETAEPVEVREMPAGYLVLPEPAGKVVNDTMRRIVDGRWIAFGQEGVLHHYVKEGEIIDIAENVLPPLPDTHELVLREPGMKWRVGNIPWSEVNNKWAESSLTKRKAVDDRIIGSPIVGLGTNQGYFGRAKRKPVPVLDGRLPVETGYVITPTTLYQVARTAPWLPYLAEFVGVKTTREGSFQCDLAENVLPPPLEGTKLHEVKDGDVWEEGDYFLRETSGWYSADSIAGVSISVSGSGQGHICRAVKVEEEEEIPPMPDGYLVVAKPGRVTVSETTRFLSAGKWCGFQDFTYGDKLADHGRRPICDLAANVLPPLPDSETHDLVQAKKGMTWQDGDVPWNHTCGSWYVYPVSDHEFPGMPGSRIEIDESTNQGFFGRLKPVKEHLIVKTQEGDVIYNSKHDEPVETDAGEYCKACGYWHSGRGGCGRPGGPHAECKDRYIKPKQADVPSEPVEDSETVEVCTHCYLTTQTGPPPEGYREEFLAKGTSGGRLFVKVE